MQTSSVMHTASVLPAVLLALAALGPRAAHAQTAPATTAPPAPWQAASPPPAGPPIATEATDDATLSPEERARIEQSAALIARGRPADALRLLDARLRPPQESPYATVPVLRRVARMMLSPDGASEPASPGTTPPSGDGDAPPADGSRSSAEAFSLYSSLFLYGVGTGVYVDVMAEIDDVRGAVWVPILLGAGGIGAAYLLDHPQRLRASRGYGISTGLTLGLAAGIALSVELEERNAYGRCEWDSVTGDSRCPFFDEGRGIATTMWLTSTAGLAAGYAVGALVQPSAANYGFVNATGLYGGLLGVMTLGVLDANEGYGLGWLLGEGVGIGLGAVMATQLKPTESQTRWMSLGVLGGGLLGAGVAVLLSESYDSASVPLLITQLGMVGGGIGGYLLGDSRREARRARRSGDRFATAPAVTPVAGGATLGLSFPNLL
jgi:hypothetical protein